LSYIGNIPGENFISFAKQNFTIVNSQTAYTLDFAVADENEIRLVINNVVQEPGSGKAYTASNTTLTLSSALTNGTDEMYCVFLGKARETVTVPTITKDKVNFISDSSSSGVISKGDGSVDGSISLNCSQNSHFTKLSSAAHGAYSGNLNFVLPSSHGSSGQFLKTDGSGNLSFASAGITMVDQFRLSASISGANHVINANWERPDTGISAQFGSIQMSQSSGIFTFPSTGFYQIDFIALISYTNVGDNMTIIKTQVTTNNSSYSDYAEALAGSNSSGGNSRFSVSSSVIVDITDTTNQKCRFEGSSFANSNVVLEGNTGINQTVATFTRIGDT